MTYVSYNIRLVVNEPYIPLYFSLALEVGFQDQTPSITEGSNVIGVIERQTIANQAPFEVTVFFRRYTGPLFVDEGALGPREDGMNINVRTSN